MHSKTEEGSERVSAEHFEFSVPDHVTFLAGYMDAVGRVLTTDSVLWGLTARDAREVLDGDLLFGVAVRARSSVENWSKEFGSLVDTFLRMNQRHRLGFYLVDYICWFKEFTQSAECFKLDCDSLHPNTIAQATYLLKLDGNHRVLLLAEQLDKTHNRPLQSDAPAARA
jgi:hypothetical protein